MAKRRIIVVGGSAAGPKAAAKARRIDNDAEVIIMQKDADLSMASYGYPYYVGGYFDDRNMLLSTPAGVTRNLILYLNAKDIEAKVNMEVTAIDRSAHRITFRNTLTGEPGETVYDKLIIATGAVPACPPCPASAWSARFGKSGRPIWRLIKTNLKRGRLERWRNIR